MLVLARGVVTLVLSLAWLSYKGISPWGVDRPRLVLRGVFGLGGLACFFYAVTQLPLAEVTVLHYLNPILTALVAWVFLGERSGGKLWGCIALSLLGTALVVRPSFLFGDSQSLSAAGVLAALGGAAFGAFAYTTVRGLRHTDDPHVIVFYFPLVAVPATLPFAWRDWTAPTTGGWLLLLGLGVATQFAQVLFTRGLALVPAGKGTTVGYVQIVFAALLGYAFFGDVPPWFSVLGALIIAVSTLLLLFDKTPATPAS
jgi:drug/metabolite transporter (DMT)-like permease